MAEKTNDPLDLQANVRSLCSDMRDFWQPLSAIPTVDAATLSPLEFYRRFVSKSVPVVLINAMESPDWAHVRSHWTDEEYLIEMTGDVPVTVDVTPFGLGDVVLGLDEQKEIFVMPEERDMPMSEFLRILEDREGFDGVPYLSHQNDSLRDQFPALFDEVPPSIDLAVEAFGNDPDAVNIWVGDERAVSSMHKDHYENMYCVVKGKKHFTLLPPAAIVGLYEQEYPSARYRHSSSPTSETDLPVDEELTKLFHAKHPEHVDWSVVASPQTGDTPWIPVDPLCMDMKKFPMAARLQPIECVVHAGQILYLPAMWYHRATQLCPTISVNYWHDMEFDCRYVYYNFVHDVAAKVVRTESSREHRN